jgi:hypothetical protein
MTQDDVRVAFSTRLTNAWTAQYPNNPIDYENQETVDMSTVVVPFIRLEIREHDSHQQDMADKPWWRVHGMARIDIFIKIGHGTKQTNDMADFLKQLFRGQMFSGITCKAPILLAPQKVDGWFMNRLLLPFQYDTQ